VAEELNREEERGRGPTQREKEGSRGCNSSSPKPGQKVLDTVCEGKTLSRGWSWERGAQFKEEEKEKPAVVPQKIF